MKMRGRFEIVAVFDSGAYTRITSDKTLSLSISELVACLRKHADHIEAGGKAEAKPVSLSSEEPHA